VASSKKPEDVQMEARNFIEKQKQQLASQMAGSTESSVPPGEQAGEAQEGAQ
jgi:hypothetical protein